MTAENFQACRAFTLKYEGGRSKDLHDPGGRTMEGVTQATYDAHRVKKALGRRDVFTMSAAERDEIYRKEGTNSEHRQANQKIALTSDYRAHRKSSTRYHWRRPTASSWRQ